MIQAVVGAGVYSTHLLSLCTQDVSTNTSYLPLFRLTSQQSNLTKYFVPLLATRSNIRRTAFLWLSTTILANENLDGGFAALGSATKGDYPYGLYDFTVYQNTSDTNLDPDGLIVLYKGIYNFKGLSITNAPVEYEEYTDNDSLGTAVYITNI